jgi:AcrR family transcriptional regulator
MRDVNQAGRTYTSTLRERQAAATRQAVLDAARELFLSQGYGATTIDQVAARAQVSKPTVFTAVGNKQALLAAVRDVALAGDDLPVAVADRAQYQAVLAEPDPYQAIVLMTAHLTELWRRYAGIREVLRGAASSGEPALRDMWDTSQRQRLTAARSFIAALVGKGPLREGLDAGAAADIAWLLMDPDIYRALTVERGWTEAAYERWLAGTLTAALLLPRAP